MQAGAFTGEGLRGGGGALTWPPRREAGLPYLLQDPVPKGAAFTSLIFLRAKRALEENKIPDSYEKSRKAGKNAL